MFGFLGWRIKNELAKFVRFLIFEIFTKVLIK